ncbi:MAG: hypothetical protein JSU03_09795 [Bacteroidetes bacterium]|nr:hypothetical protein [Bacteroidota bacterium]MBS1757559.1 hypothetical protein [Bacteroidota bacterium]
MSCNFNIPFAGSATIILQKAKTAVESQGGNFTGDESAGNFNVSIFGNLIVGSYSVAGQQLNLLISEKPFMIPCSTIESFLKKQLS